MGLPAYRDIRVSLVNRIERASILRLLIVYALSVLIFGIFYYLFTFIHQGMTGTGAGNEPSFLDSLYFSVVTISSLGYGDIRPIGWSRVLASAEVLIGLSILGILVAKLTSRRLAHHVQRLFVTDSQRQLTSLFNDFTAIAEALLRETPRFVSAYQKTPNAQKQPATNPTHIEQEATDFARQIARLTSLSIRFQEYMIAECQDDQYFDILPVELLQRGASDLNGAIFTLSQLIISLPIEGRNDLLSLPCRSDISKTIGCHKQVCSLIKTHAKSQPVKDAFAVLTETCMSFPQAYYATPTPPQLQPNQIPETGDTPLT